VTSDIVLMKIRHLYYTILPCKYTVKYIQRFIFELQLPVNRVLMSRPTFRPVRWWPLPVVRWARLLPSRWRLTFTMVSCIFYCNFASFMKKGQRPA